MADVDVCNEALSTIGIGTEIHDLDTESSAEAQACRRFFAPARDAVLRDFPWPRLKTLVLLQVVETQPSPQWGFSYRMPDNVASIIRLQVDQSPRLDNTSTRIVYELGRDDTGALIYTDFDNVSAKYIYAETNLDRWTPDMLEVLVYLVASKIAPRFGPEAVKLGTLAYQLYERRRGIAREQALNEEAIDQVGDGDFVRARDSAAAPFHDSFIRR